MSSFASSELASSRLASSDNYVIEIRSQPTGRTVQAGIVVRDGRGFRFFAALDDFYALEQRVFKNPGAAEHAARRHDADRSARQILSCRSTAADRRSQTKTH